MNIIVYSDTHGELDRAVEMYERITSFCDVDLILHCGDFARDAIELAGRLGRTAGKDVVYVQGNCDGCTWEDHQIVETPAGKIIITHGHMENVNMTLQNLVYLAQEKDCKAVCFGHTHISGIWTDQGIRIVNPGSLTRPLGGSRASCALIVATEKGFSASVMNY
ncbi:MAG: metallophosphoesterase [Mogibacterium sp.]|nr:metallophosphoesterase [Mogibacterium sp.]